MSETESKKTAADIPATFVIASPEVSPAAAASLPPKTHFTKKYLIIAVGGIVTVAIVLTAILVGMYLFTDAHKNILKFNLDVDKNTKEEVTSDRDSNVVQYHVQTENYEMWVIDDFNRDIQVMKVKSESDTKCYISPLNRTASADPSEVTAPSNINSMKSNNTNTVKYHASNTPVSDISFLTKTGRDACKGISTYWLYPTCQTSLAKEKRSLCFYYCYYYYCYCYFGSCNICYSCYFLCYY